MVNLTWSHRICRRIPRRRMKEKRPKLRHRPMPDWAGIGPRPNQFARFDFQSVLWEEIEEDEIQEMWGIVFYEKNFITAETDYMFMREEFRAEHTYWAYYWEYMRLLDIKYDQPGILRNGLTLPKWCRPPKVWPKNYPHVQSMHMSRVIDVGAMEEFAYSEEPENPEIICKHWQENWGTTRIVFDNVNCMKIHFRRLDKWELKEERNEWLERAKWARLRLFWAQFSGNCNRPLPDWMFKVPSIARNVYFMWYNVWSQLICKSKLYRRTKAWNEAYAWNETYRKPRKGIFPCEPYLDLYSRSWEAERVALEKIIKMSRQLQEQRFNRLIHRDLYWDKRMKRFLRIPELPVPVPAKVSFTHPFKILPSHVRKKKKQEGEPEPVDDGVFDVHAEYEPITDPALDPPMNIFRDDDEEEEKYNRIHNERKDGIPPSREEPLETVQNIWDKFFLNVKNENYAMLWDPEANHDHFHQEERINEKVYKPKIPPPEQPHKYLRRGETRKRIAAARAVEMRELRAAQKLEMKELIKTGCCPLWRPWKPPPFEHLTLPHQDRRRLFRAEYRFMKARRVRGLSPLAYEDRPPRPPPELDEPAWKEAKRLENEARARRAKMYRQNRLKRQREAEYDRENPKFYHTVADHSSVSHLIGIRSKACSFAAAKMVRGVDWAEEMKSFPSPLEKNGFMSELDYDSMAPLSDKARDIMKFMKRQNAAADDILRHINTEDGGQGWNAERKARRSQDSDVSQLSDLTVKSETLSSYYPYKY